MEPLYIIIIIIFVIIFIAIISYSCVCIYKSNSSVRYFVINLERSDDRKQLCEEEFKKFGINNYDFVIGVDGEQYNNKNNMLVKNNYSPHFCIDGLKHIGCYLSHVKAIKEFYNGKSDFGIILEDDFSFDTDPKQYIKKCKDFLTSDVPKMVVLSNNFGDKTQVKEIQNLPGWNAVGYMLNKSAAKILIELLSPDSDFLNKNYPIEGCLYDFALFKAMDETIEWKWLSLISQRPQLISTITETIRDNDYIETDFLNANNYKFDFRTHAINLGDSASKTFIEKLCKVKFGTGKIIGPVITIGSILTYARDNTIVWGSGFLTDKEIMKYKPKKIYSVRGPKSYDKLVAQNIECPKIFGDPFFIVPLIYKITKTKKLYDIGIIPHYKNKNKISSYIKKFKNLKIKIIDIQTTNIQKFIDELNECSEIYSNPLHGIIISLAYKIPTRWIKLKKGNEDDFKYYDFLESLNVFEYEPETIIEMNSNDDMINLGIQIIRSCPFMKKVLKDKYCNEWIEYSNA